MDYAGLFPPAELSLEDAVTNFAAYRHSDDAWMLGHFVIPASRLSELSSYTDLFQPDDPFPVSAIGSGGGGLDGFTRAFANDVALMAAFEAEHVGRVRAALLEVKVPERVTEGHHDDFAFVLEQLAEAADRSPLQLDRLCLEVPFTGEWRRYLPEVMGVLARAPAALPAIALKFRCGGPVATAVPTPEQLAFAIVQAREAGLPFKATAGLHHPVRHHNRHLEVMEHGFLNVFGAGVLAHALELSEAALRQILRSEVPRAFVFDNEGFGFQDLRISTEQLAAARAHFALSFGSCSFDEPRQDLRALGVL